MTKPVVEEQGRKVTPSEVLRARLEELMLVAQDQAAAREEKVIFKASFLSEEDEDTEARVRMADVRARRKAAGVRYITLGLDVTEQAAVMGARPNEALATAIRKLIGGQIRGPYSRYVPPVPDDEQDEAPAATSDIDPADILAKVRGRLVEVWALKGDTFDGIVINGRIRGARLSQLDYGYLVQLWKETQERKDSRDVADDMRDQAMLEGYLDWRFEDWREFSTPEAQTQAAQAEPYEILGIPRSSSFEEARSAYKRAALASHPDRGGNAWFFRQVTQAFNAIKAAEEARQRVEQQQQKAA
jgi:hypothetical protein